MKTTLFEITDLENEVCVAECWFRNRLLGIVICDDSDMDWPYWDIVSHVLYHREDQTWVTEQTLDTENHEEDVEYSLTSSDNRLQNFISESVLNTMNTKYNKVIKKCVLKKLKEQIKHL